MVAGSDPVRRKKAHPVCRLGSSDTIEVLRNEEDRFIMIQPCSQKAISGSNDAGLDQAIRQVHARRIRNGKDLLFVKHQVDGLVNSERVPRNQ